MLLITVALSAIVCPAGTVRSANAADVLNTGAGAGAGCGVAVATGGVLFHYNPPYGDIFMEVHESYRQRGFGSYMVQELKRICYEMGKTPAARCNVSNVASRRTMEKAGLLPCGRILLGDAVRSTP